MSVTTVNVVDPRLEIPDNPVYPITKGAREIQPYRIPASGLSDSIITFNNLTMLGPNRVYMDTFEVEYVLEITMHGPAAAESSGFTIIPSDTLWGFESWPLNKSMDQCRVNINGASCTSRPAYDVRPRERYWDQETLLNCYADTVPCIKPNVNVEWGDPSDSYRRCRLSTTTFAPFAAVNTSKYPNKQPFLARKYINSITYASTAQPNATAKIIATIREPIFVSPFNSKLNRNYGSPLFNITSLDFTFTLNKLENMIIVHPNQKLSSYEVTIREANICYDVLSLQPNISVPPVLMRPYIVRTPYVTDFKGTTDPEQLATNTQTVTSGVYTLGSVPTAIWIYVAPSLGEYSQFKSDSTDVASHFFNKMYGTIEHVSITLGNTTQILNTSTPYELFRICKANGLQDDFTAFSPPSRITQHLKTTGSTSSDFTISEVHLGGLAGSVLRLIPGTDLITPQQLVPGSNADQLNCQVSVNFKYDFGSTDITNAAYKNTQLALWLLFEYSGVIKISPGFAETDTMPVKDANVAIMAADAAPTIAPSSIGVDGPSSDVGQAEGSGWLDNLKKGLGKFWNIVKQSGLIGTAARMGTQFLPGPAKGLADPLIKIADGIQGSGYDGMYDDDDDVSGGAVMGLGDFC